MWFLVDEQPKHVRSRVMTDDVEVELAARDLIEVDVREQNLLTIPGGPGEHLAKRVDDAATAAAYDVNGVRCECVGMSCGKSRRRVN